MIYSINTEDYALYPTYKSFFAMSDEMVYNMINDDFNDLKELLRKKGIDYLKLKSALIPNQDKENNEVCLVFDTCFIDDCYYGMEIFSKLIPLFNKESTFSVLSGDYIDILYKNNSEDILHQMFEKSITIIKDSTYKYHNQFYLVYINNCCKTQFRTILDGLNDYRAFVGYAVINNSSPFKMYLSAIIKSTFIKAKKAIIMPHGRTLALVPEEDSFHIVQPNGVEITDIPAVRKLIEKLSDIADEMISHLETDIQDYDIDEMLSDDELRERLVGAVAGVLENDPKVDMVQVNDIGVQFQNMISVTPVDYVSLAVNFVFVSMLGTVLMLLGVFKYV